MFLVIGSDEVEVPVDARSSPIKKINYARDEERNFDNSLSVAVTGIDKQTWEIKTPPMSTEAADAIEAALAELPCPVYGDWIGVSAEAPIDCFGTLSSREGMATSSGFKVFLSITLNEA